MAVQRVDSSGSEVRHRGAPARAAERPAPDEVESDREDVRIRLGGLVNPTLFYQDEWFLPDNGQLALLAIDGEEYYGGDLRNSRIFLDVDGPRVFDRAWDTGGYLEIDFFGGTRDCGSCDPLGFLSQRPRLFRAYVDVIHEGTRVHMGQDFSLLWGYTPASVSRISFPVGHGTAGFIGFYYPGIFFTQAFTIQGATKGMFRAAALQGAWVNMFPNFIATVASPTAVSPQLEARFDIDHLPVRGGTSWSAFVAGHYDRKNLGEIPAGPGEDVTDAEDVLTGWAVEGGTRIRANPVTFQGGIYRGHAIGQQFAQIFQFGDITGWGFWVQAGFDVARHWSLWAFYGRSDQDDDNLAVTRPENWAFVPMLRYQAGPFELGLEWFHVVTDFIEEDDTGARTRFGQAGNQFALSTIMHF